MKASKSVQYLCQAAFALGSVLVAGIPAHGQGGVPGYPDDLRYAFDPREVALLPRYCLSTQLFRDSVVGTKNKREVEGWYLEMGPTFNAMHHYCWGLMNTNRALLLVHTERWRKYYLGMSIGEFNYVIDRAPLDFKMLPEILTKKCENLFRLDRGTEGVRECERAIALKPDYWPSYAAVSDYYRKIGDVAKAREWLEEGLSVTPDVKALKRRKAELDASKGKHMAAPQSGMPQQPLKP
jgi:tetratricopeptide (TPR) repeat protein